MPAVSIAAASIACIASTETARERSLDTGEVLEGVGTEDYEPDGGALPGVWVEASSFSLAAALRAFIFICLIFGKPNTERPSTQRPCVMRWRTRSCRFITLRSDPAAFVLVRNDEWTDML